MKIVGITEQEKAKLLKLRDSAISALAKFCDALDEAFGEAPAKKPTKAKAKAKPAEAELPLKEALKAAEVKEPKQHPGMKVIKASAKGNGAAHEGLAEL